MARQLAKLSPRTVATLKKPGRHSDGGGLYLVVDKPAEKPGQQIDPNDVARRWVFIYRWKRPGETGPGKLREMGLGSLASVPLEKARKKAAAARSLLDDGIDPIGAKRADRPAPTFGALADELIAVRSAELRNEKSKARWKRALETYAADLRPKPVDTIQTEDVLAVLQPIWGRIPESAKLARGYIEAVLDAAKAKGYRTGENPARWRGHLDHLLARPKRLNRGHHAALAFAEVPEFVAELRQREASVTLALEFLILCAARSGEVIGAKWEEIDLAAKVWTVPADRMKAGREHRVPLGDRATSILGKARALAGDSLYLFPGKDPARPLSNMAFDMLLRRMKRDVTTHGFRSSFRDWAGEATNFPREVAEAALAHVVGDTAERAYRRGDALEKRRKLMEAWARFCEPRKDNVTSFPRAATSNGA